MKRFTTLIALLSVMLTAMAQRPLVTLSHNGELSFFSNLSAFEEALDSAQNGDIIYLSEGKFAATSNYINIDKRLSIIGCGYKSHVLPEIDIDMSKNPNSYMEAPLFDGVRLSSVWFSPDTVSRNNLKEAEIRKTWIEDLHNIGYGGNNVRIDKCLIERAYFSGADIIGNITVIQNSKIYQIPRYYDNNLNLVNPIYDVTVINCNIKATYYCPGTTISSILEDNIWDSYIHYYGSGANHKLYNSLFPKTNISTVLDFHDCYFYSEGNTLFNDDLETTINLVENGYLGDDGKEVGVYGGEFPFSENPSVPTVDSANSKVEYDAENNKLNVTISVTPN
ncbi:MAG: hypothetical protein K2H47_02670 [Muribaculaceae bacterium]|nr:hypothetical protein [Muribaculaceae bacterium]